MIFKSGFLKIYSRDISQLHQITDVIILSFSFLIINKSNFLVNSDVFRFTLIISALGIFISNKTNLFKSFREKSLIYVFQKIFSTLIIFTTSFIAICFLFNILDALSIKNIIIWTSTNLIFLSAKHIFVRKFLRIYRIKGGNKRSILFWGPYSEFAIFKEELNQNSWMGYEISKWFSPVKEDNFSKREIQCSGNIKELKSWLNKNNVDNIFFTDYLSDDALLENLISIFGDTSSVVTYNSHWFKDSMIFNERKIGESSFFDLWGKENNLLANFIKNTFDLLFAFILLTILLPFLLLVSILIKTTSEGPIIFKQERYGLDGKKFNIFKFRTMKIEINNSNVIKQAQKNDSRITQIGKFLRKWSIDELPQLINILRGEMSFVGPRPHASQHNEFYRKQILGYMQRHAFKPGITGLAQVEGYRGETASIEDMKKRVQADLKYLKNWNVGLDLIILIKTLWNINTKKSY